MVAAGQLVPHVVLGHVVWRVVPPGHSLPHPFPLQSKSRPAGCTIPFPLLPDMHPTCTGQLPGPGAKEAGMALLQVQGCPEDSRCDDGTSLPGTGHASW